MGGGESPVDMSSPRKGEGAEEPRSGSERNAPPLRRSSAPLRYIGPVTVALAALWLYRDALHLAFFNDDPTGHFAWMEGRTMASFFASSAAYGYYRPVVFAALRLFETLFGTAVWPHNPFADHALLLLLHAANTALVWALARRLSGRAAYAWVAALLFATVPFSYEAVAYVASLTHPLVVFWILAALLVYDRRRPPAVGRQTTDDGPQPAWNRQLAAGRWPLATLFTILALLTHENGLFVLPALVGVDWLRRPGDGLRARAGRLWSFAAPAVLYLLLWASIPKNSQEGLNSLADAGRNAVPFLQTVVYPLLPLLRLDAGDVTLLVALAAAVVGLFGWLAWRARVGRLWAFAAGWIVLSALPSLLFLNPAYVYGSPRLSYLPAVGVGLLWGLPLLFRNRITSAKPGFYRLASIILSAGFTLALVLPARPFVRCQLDFYADTSRMAREMALSAAAAPAGRPVVFVNAPFFFSSTTVRPDGCPNPYAWTPTGGILLPPYAQARDFVRFNGGPDRDAAGVVYSGYGPGWRTFGPEIDGGALRAAVGTGAVYVFDLARGGFFDLTATWQPGGGATKEPLVSFGAALALTEATATAAGDALDARLDWRVLAPPALLPAVFVHVYDPAGALAAQSDAPPAGGLVPLDLWRPGDGLVDVRHIDLSALPSGRYTVVVGVYDPAGGQRLAAQTAGGRLPDDIWVIGEFER